MSNDPVRDAASGQLASAIATRLGDVDYRRMVEAVADYAFFLLDPAGLVLSWNTGARKLTGYEADEVLGQPASIFYPRELHDQHCPAHALKTAAETGVFEDEGWHVRKDGTQFWAHALVTQVQGGQGELLGFSTLMRDLSKRRRISLLEEEGRRMTNFLAMLAQELRHPLTPLFNAVTLLAHEKSESKAVQATRDLLDRQVSQLNSLADHLLDVSQITSGKIQLAASPVRVCDVVREAVASVQPLAQSKSHCLDVQLGEDDLWVFGDRARIVQILSHLLGNAVKFTPENGHVRVQTKASAASVQIVVADNGPGIPPENLARVFDLFVQGRPDAAQLQGGLGLGLSVVKQLVALQGGEVAAFSQGVPGEGCEFVVTLPAAPVAPAAEVAEPAPFAGKRVLVVDDNRDAAETMALLLDTLGYVPSMAFDGLAAIEAIKAEVPDLVLLDIGLPGISGIEVASRVRAEMQNPPAMIALTGYGQDKDREASFQAGFYDHMTKPVNIDKLIELLERLLGASSQTLEKP
ncbi:MAG: domain S-box protein [Polaromonas sp.]|nr:domain S-box protein [Polaromonas sp.]